jgi:hypothetical protein
MAAISSRLNVAGSRNKKERADYTQTTDFTPKTPCATIANLRTCD